LVGKKIAQYEVEAELGQGGMGVVYQAKDTILERTVALKFLPAMFSRDEDAKKRFVHEARAVSVLDHPNIAVVHEIGGVDSDEMFIVMAYYKGQTLEEIIEDGPVNLDDVVRYTLETARGLSEAHAKNIVHRDIKPGNIMVTESGLLKILDFGLAKVSDVTMTMGAVSLGTLAYMSPEQAQGQPVDNRTDLWALGVVMYEMLAGKRPFDGPYDAAILYAAANEEHESVSTWRNDTPEHIVQIVDKLLQKQPDRRYQSAQELIKDLESAQAPPPALPGNGSEGEEGKEVVEAAAAAATQVASKGIPRALVIASIVVGVGVVGALSWSMLGGTNGSPDVVLDREAARNHLSEGISRLNEGKYSLALASIERSILSDSTFAPAWSSLSAVQFQLNNFDESIRAADRAISMDAASTGAYYNKGLSLAERGDVEGAIQELAAAVRLNPAFTQAYSAWGDILIEDGRADEALEILDQGAQRAEPGLKFIIYKNQGKAHMELRQFQEAVNYLEASYKENPRWPETVMLLARAYDAVGDRDRATPLWQEYLQLETDPSRRAAARARLNQ